MSKVRIIAQCASCGKVLFTEEKPENATSKSTRTTQCTGCKTRNRVEIIGTQVFVSIAK